jgi:hypothetical protein
VALKLKTAIDIYSSPSTGEDKGNGENRKIPFPLIPSHKGRGNYFGDNI